MEKKFKYFIACPVTKDEYESVIEDLRSMGYQVKDYENYTALNIYPNKIDVNYRQREPGVINSYLCTKNMDFAISLDEFNKELILALAASTENEEVFAEEYVIFPSGYPGWMLQNVPVKVVRKINENTIIAKGTHPNRPGWEGGFTNRDIVLPHSFRKATKEELLNYFLKTKTEKNMENKITGYKLKDAKYFKATSNILYGNDYGSGYLKTYIPIDSPRIQQLKELKVLDTWFDPIYAEEVKLAGYSLTRINENEFSFGCFASTIDNLLWLKHLLMKEEAEAVLLIKGERITTQVINKILNS